MPRHVTKTFSETVSYIEYEPGDKVIPAPGRTSLEPKEYEVEKFVPPSTARETTIVFLKGRPFGINAENFIPATPTQAEKSET